VVIELGERPAANRFGEGAPAWRGWSHNGSAKNSRCRCGTRAPATSQFQPWPYEMRALSFSDEVDDRQPPCCKRDCGDGGDNDWGLTLGRCGASNDAHIQHAVGACCTRLRKRQEW
jgi:hypothetical protein